jgi:acid phosphatase (class A)
MRNLTAIAISTLLGATAIASFAAAQTTKPTPKLIFISPDAFDPALLLPAPVAPDSTEGKADLAEVQAIVKAATPAEIRQAAMDDENESIALYSETLPGFDLTKLPATAKLFHDVENDQEIITKKTKTYFARVRPFDLDHSLSTCVPSPFGKAPTSYPSGHSTLGYTDGIILAHLMPAKATTILLRAKAYAHNRVICGVHFTSDTAASEALATGLAIELMHNAQFQTEFAAARAELIAAGLTQ